MKKANTLRILSLLAAASLSLCACSSGSPAASSAPASSAPAAPASSAPAESSAPASSSAPAAGTLDEIEAPYPCTEEPLTLSAHIHWGNTQVLQDGNWSIINKAAEITGITLKGTASPMETDSTQAFNLMIASKDIPDMVGGNRDLINQYGMEGAFMPLNDLIEQYAPDFKAVLDANPDILGAITAADGNIYQVPFVYEELLSEAWFIRQDWLDKLNLEIPTTVDEFHDVLVAFVNEDPNGNGKKDEVGIFTRLGANNNNVLSVLALFGVSDYWHLGKDGKVHIGLYTPEYQQAIKNVSQWYAEGLIDKEIFTRGGQSRDMLFPENNGGAIHDWIPSTSGYNPKISESVPGFKLVGMLPPTDVNGDQWEVASRDKLSGAGWAISANNQHPEESMKYMNFWWTEEGRRLSTYGIYNDDYTLDENGDPVYTDKVLKAADPINVFIRNEGGMIDDIGYLHDASYENFMMDEEGQKTKELYNEAGVVNKLYPKLPALSFTVEELDLVNSKYPPIRTHMLEQLQKWTFDGSNIDAEFPAYMDTLKSMGIEDVIATYQAAYDRLMGN